LASIRFSTARRSMAEMHARRLHDHCRGLTNEFALKSSLCRLVIKNSHRVSETQRLSTMNIYNSILGVSVPQWHRLSSCGFGKRDLFGVDSLILYILSFAPYRRIFWLNLAELYSPHCTLLPNDLQRFPYLIQNTGNICPYCCLDRKKGIYKTLIRA